MKIKHYAVLLASLTLLVVFQNREGGIALAAEISAKPTITEGQFLELLLSTNSLTSRPQEELTGMIEQRRKNVQKMMAIVRGVQPDAVKQDAIILLGIYRAGESAPLLVQQLDLPPRGKPPSPFARNDGRDKYQFIFYDPTVWALGSIGLPAIHPLMERLATEDNALLVKKCLRICIGIEGPEVTQFRLQRLAEKETDPKKKEHLQSALKLHETLQPAK